MKEGDEVIVAGFAAEAKEMGKIAFITLRDRSGTVQIVSTPENHHFKDIKGISKESVVAIKGKVKASKLKSGAKELQLEELEVITASQPNLPIDFSGKVPTNLDKRLDFRILDLRNPKVLAIFKIRSRVNMAVREFLIGEGFIEMQTPKLISAGAEGGATLFPVVYYNKKAFLSQSQQLYKQMMLAAGFEKVFEIGPTFRAEKSKTRRHLTEFWMVEPEMAYATLEDVKQVAEELIVFVVGRVLENRRAELAVLERDVSKLEAVRAPFPRISYDQAVEILRKKGSNIEWGGDFGGTDETLLSEDFDRPVMVDRYPAQIKAFYFEPDPQRPDVVLGVDVLAPEGYGEIVGGGQRIHDLALLEKRLAEHNLPREAFEWYLDLRRFGSVPHGGFGMGVERCVAWLCGLEHVRETIAFPRMLYRTRP